LCTNKVIELGKFLVGTSTVYYRGKVYARTRLKQGINNLTVAIWLKGIESIGN